MSPEKTILVQAGVTFSLVFAMLVVAFYFIHKDQ